MAGIGQQNGPVTASDERATGMDRSTIQRRAGSALRKAGRAQLSDLEIRPASSSPRHWLADHRWWLINIEFQASRWSVGSYLNVGVQYLWTVTNRRSFDHGNPRVSIPEHGQFVELAGTEESVRARAEDLARAARNAVLLLAESTIDELAHLNRLSRQTGSGPWQSLDIAIAKGLLGQRQRAADALHALVRRVDPAIAWQEQLAEDSEHLAELVFSPEEFRTEIGNRVMLTRKQLKLPVVDDHTSLDLLPCSQAGTEAQGR